MVDNDLTKDQLLQELQELRDRVAELQSDEIARKHAETLLKESEAKTRAILEAIPDLMFRLSRDGTHLEFHTSRLDQLFVQPEDFLGKRVDEVLPDDVGGKYTDNIQRTLDSSQSQVFEYYLDFEGSGRVYYEARMVPVWQDEVIVIVRDITERKQAEEVLRFQAQLLDAAGQAIIATNLEGEIIYWSRYAETLYGWEAAEAIGRNIVDVTPTDATREQAAEIMAELAKGEYWSGEFLVQRKDGTTFPAIVVDAPINDKAGNLIGIIGVSSDISERKRAEQQRMELGIERERTQILSNFITKASHEFKTPLSIIGSSVYLLKQATDPDTQEKQLGRIENQVASIATLVDELTNMAKLDSIRELGTEQVDLNQVIRAIHTKLHNALQSKDIHCSIELKKERLTVRADLNFLHQAIEAVIDNAIRFTPEGDTIKICADSCDGNAIIEIVDTGEGISDDDLPHIFERFYRADTAGTTRGFGLGLAIAKRVLELHHGNIEAESTMGKGSTFKIILPLV